MDSGNLPLSLKKVDFDSLPPLLKVNAVAEITGLSAYKVRDLIRKGKLPGFVDNRTFRVYTEAFRRQLEGKGA